MENIREYYLTWLRDAHAMEEQAITMIQGMLNRLQNYPELRARLQQHLSETEGHRDRLHRLLEQQDTSGSLTKDMFAKMVATGQAMSGVFVSDEVMKGTMASYAFENLEIAAYTILIATASELGETEAVRVFEGILSEEVAMSEWLRQNIAGTTRIYLTRVEADVTAKR